MSRVEQAGSGKKLLMTASRASHITQFHLPLFTMVPGARLAGGRGCAGQAGHPPYSDHYYELPFSKKDISFQNIKTAFLAGKADSPGTLQPGYFACDTCRLYYQAGGCAVRLPIGALYCGLPWLFVQGGRRAENRLYFFCERLFRGRVDCLLTMNRADEELAKANRLCRHIAAIPGMGICPEALPRLSAEEKEREKSRLYGEWDLSDRQTLLLCVGEFSGQKKPATFDRGVFANVAGRYPQARLLLAGGRECCCPIAAVWYKKRAWKRRCFFWASAGRCRRSTAMLL